MKIQTVARDEDCAVYITTEDGIAVTLWLNKEEAKQLAKALSAFTRRKG